MQRRTRGRTSQRRGSTGIGHTLEQLLGVPENNDPGGDFRGIEVKAEREQERPNPHRRVNLFLKEPTWLDDWSGVERIRRLGYEDPNGRDALYQTVTARDNSAGMRLEVDVSANALLLIHNADAIAWCVTRPAHVNVDRLVIRPRAQAAQHKVHRVSG